MAGIHSHDHSPCALISVQARAPTATSKSAWAWSADIDSVGDRDWHRVELQAGVTYQVDMEGYATGSFSTPKPWIWISDYTLFDPVLSGVYDSLGALVPGTGDLTDSGNGGTAQNSRFTFSPTVDGTYYVEATATSAWVGTYLLTVSRITQ